MVTVSDGWLIVYELLNDSVFALLTQQPVYGVVRELAAVPSLANAAVSTNAYPQLLTKLQFMLWFLTKTFQNQICQFLLSGQDVLRGFTDL